MNESEVLAASASTGSADRALLRVPGQASFFYHDPYFQRDAVKVMAGEHFVTSKDLLLMTVLGSCIAACIWDPKVGLGGMNHFMLPDGGGESSALYGDRAMDLLISQLLQRGARRERMQAKVFGGAQVMQGFKTLKVGEINTTFVLNYLHSERIAVVSQDVLDVHPRKLCFFPNSGQALVKRLPLESAVTAAGATDAAVPL